MSLDPALTRLPECPACGLGVEDFQPGVSSKIRNGALYHPACAVADVPDDTRVIWDGEETTWGTLSQNERMACEENADGVLEGGNRF